MISLGDTVRDVITGFTGIVVAHIVSTYEAEQFCVQPKALTSEGQPVAAVCFETARLEVLPTVDHAAGFSM